MTQSNPTSSTVSTGNPTAPRDAAADLDPILHLHKMSTTAGVGTQEYAAVNVTAVVAVLFGLASLLAMASTVLFIFPVVGVILGFIALRQVRNSSGTQTGKSLAILGLALSGAITAVIFCAQGLEVLHRRTDQQALADLSQKYGEFIAANKFDQAYDLFDGAFKERVSKETFTVHLATLQHQGSVLPPIDSVTWNGYAEFHTQDEGVQIADAVIKVHNKGNPAYDEYRLNARFRRDGNGPWLFDNIPDQFPPLKQAPGK